MKQKKLPNAQINSGTRLMSMSSYLTLHTKCQVRSGHASPVLALNLKYRAKLPIVAEKQKILPACQCRCIRFMKSSLLFLSSCLPKGLRPCVNCSDVQRCNPGQHVPDRTISFQLNKITRT